MGGRRMGLQVPGSEPRRWIQRGLRGRAAEPDRQDKGTLRRILVVEDEKAIAADVLEALSGIGYVVDVAADGEDAWFRGSTEDYDAIILDLSLPRLDGLSVLQRLRSEAIQTLILVLTARSAWLQRVEGIDAGADDYLTKPFHMEELIARIGALLRRVGGHSTPVLAVGDLHIYTCRLRALRNGRAIDLTPLEFRLHRRPVPDPPEPQPLRHLDRELKAVA